MINRYKVLSPEKKIALGIQFVQSGVTLPEDLRTFFVDNNLLVLVKSIGEHNERYEEVNN